ncbi:MAG TPA: GGDEF domain-containing protein, partial [Myxococcota bacterium]|nr:GGDEF domain-containing protein [Myxococcota bacterium]
MNREWLGLVWPGDPAGLLERRRSVAIVQRVRGIALLFAVLTSGWIVVDAAAFPAATWKPLALARVVATLALLALAHSCRLAAPTRAAARLRLALLYALPTLFQVAALEILAETPGPGVAPGLAAAYGFVPFMLAAGIAAFPLAAAECLLVALFALTLALWAIAG